MDNETVNCSLTLRRTLCILFQSFIKIKNEIYLSVFFSHLSLIFFSFRSRDLETSSEFSDIEKVNSKKSLFVVFKTGVMSQNGLI